MAEQLACLPGHYFDTNVGECTDCLAMCSTAVPIPSACFDTCQAWRLARQRFLVTPLSDDFNTTSVSQHDDKRTDVLSDKALIAFVTAATVTVVIVIVLCSILFRKGCLVLYRRARKANVIMSETQPVLNTNCDLQHSQYAVDSSKELDILSLLLLKLTPCCQRAWKNHENIRLNDNTSGEMGTSGANADKNSLDNGHNSTSEASASACCMHTERACGQQMAGGLESNVANSTEQKDTETSAEEAMCLSERAGEAALQQHGSCNNYLEINSLCEDFQRPSESVSGHICRQQDAGSPASLGRLRADDSLPSEDTNDDSLPVKQWLCQQPWLMGYSQPTDTDSLHIAVNIDHQEARAQVQACALQNGRPGFKFRIVQPNPGRYVPSCNMVHSCSRNSGNLLRYV